MPGCLTPAATGAYPAVRWALDASKELDTAKETIYRASPTPAGVGLARLSHFIS